MSIAASLPLSRLDGARSAPLLGRSIQACHLKGDAMDYDADSLIELQREARLRRQRHAEYQQIVPKIEMLVGAWYVDQFGNKTREVKARD
jgi:hypothetical protein